MITPAYGITATERVLPRLALDFTTGVLDSRVTVTRALNTATRTNSSGYIEGVNADLPRFDYDPVTLAPRGLLIEEQRTNLLLWSEDMTKAVWAPLNGTIASSSVVGPNGLTNLAVFTATSAGCRNEQYFNLPSGATYTMSVVLAAGTSNFGGLVAAGSANAGAIYNLTGAGAVVSTIGSGVSATIQKLSATLYRCTLTFTTTSTVTTPCGWGVSDGSTYAFGIYPSASSGTVYGSFAQLEAGAFATSYIPTTTTSLTRNADVVGMTGTNFSSWYNASEGSFVAEASSFSPPSASSLYWVLSANDGATSNTINVVAFNNLWIGSVAVGGVSQADLAQTGVYTAGATAKIALGYKANSFAASVNGLTPLTDNSGSVPSVNRLDLGNLSGIFYLDGHIRKLNYYPQRLTNAELQAFSK